MSTLHTTARVPQIWKGSVFSGSARHWLSINQALPWGIWDLKWPNSIRSWNPSNHTCCFCYPELLQLSCPGNPTLFLSSRLIYANLLCLRVTSSRRCESLRTLNSVPMALLGKGWSLSNHRVFEMEPLGQHMPQYCSFSLPVHGLIPL